MGAFVILDIVVCWCGLDLYTLAVGVAFSLGCVWVVSCLRLFVVILLDDLVGVVY